MRMIGMVFFMQVFVVSVACPLMPTDAGAQEAPAYVGTWLRVEKYANEAPLEVQETATLVLGRDSFASVSRGVPGAECDNSGRLEVADGTLTMTVTESTCPSIITVGSVVKSTYILSADRTRLTMLNTEWGYTYKEVLVRQ